MVIEDITFQRILKHERFLWNVRIPLSKSIFINPNLSLDLQTLVIKQTKRNFINQKKETERKYFTKNIINVKHFEKNS